MKKTIAALLAGIAFVAGGFFAGTFGASDTAAAEEGDTAVTADAPAWSGEHRADHRRGPMIHMLESAAEFLDLEPVEVLEALADGGVLADLTDDDAGLVAAIVAAAEADIDQAVTDGRMDADRADALKDQLADRVETFITTSHERPDDRPFHDRHVRGFVKEAADVIGIDAADLVEGLADGKSIADVALENGLSESDLVDALTDAARERIEEAVNKTKP